MLARLHRLTVRSVRRLRDMIKVDQGAGEQAAIGALKAGLAPQTRNPARFLIRAAPRHEWLTDVRNSAQHTSSSIP
jgi:hypothetical protein